MFRRLSLFLLIALVAGGAGPPTTATKEIGTAEKHKGDNIADNTRALDEPTNMEFVDTPLADVIDYLKDLHKQKHAGFEIVLDTKALSDLGITPETPITKCLKGVSLRSAFRLLLRDLGLSYVVRDEVLLITSREEACYTKVYDVADLVSAKEGEKNSSLDSLLTMIAKTCPPSAPPGKAGWPGWIESLRSTDITAIVVHEPEEFQEEVADLLAQLRAVRH